MPGSGDASVSLAISGKNNFLVVDDSPDIRSVLSAFIEACDNNSTVFTACDGTEAVRCLMSSRIDVLLTDVHMPRMNGLELVAYTMEHNPGTKIIVMSGDDHPALPSENISFIQKPFLLKDIAKIVVSAPASA